ncbi:unnamed protein product, partial [Amoebophrya sp. A25]
AKVSCVEAGHEQSETDDAPVEMRVITTAERFLEALATRCPWHEQPVPDKEIVEEFLRERFFLRKSTYILESYGEVPRTKDEISFTANRIRDLSTMDE